MDKRPAKFARGLAQYTSLVFILPSTVFAGYLVGSWLDGFFETEPVLAMIGLLLGAVIGFHQMYRILTRSS